MPAHDVEVTGSFTLMSNVSSVYGDDDTTKYYNINGQRIAGKRRGIIIQNNKKVFVK